MIEAKVKKQKPKRHLGNLNITSADMVSAKTAKIGSKIQVVVEIEVTGLSKPDVWDIEQHGMKATDVNLRSDILSIREYKNAKKDK